MGADWAELRRLALGQDGLFARWQAELCGVSERMRRTRVSRGDWIVLLPGVFSAADQRLTTERRVRAAALCGGRGSVVGGAAAAWWWELTRVEPRVVDLYLGSGRQLRNTEWVRVIRSGIPAEDQATHRGVRVSGLSHAALFGAVALGPQGQQVFDRALLRVVRLEEAQATLTRNAGARGALLARQWMRAAADGSAAESERLFARLLRSAGIAGWAINRGQRTVGGPFLPDFVFAAARVVVEIDGWAFHSDPERFGRDRARQNRIVLGGWSVLRFTWAQLTDQPERVVDEVRSLLAMAAAK